MGLWKIQPQWVVTPGKQTNNMYLTGQMVRLTMKVVTQNDRCFMRVILLQQYI